MIVYTVQRKIELRADHGNVKFAQTRSETESDTELT